MNKLLLEYTNLYNHLIRAKKNYIDIIIDSISKKRGIISEKKQEIEEAFKSIDDYIKYLNVFSKVVSNSNPKRKEEYKSLQSLIKKLRNINPDYLSKAEYNTKKLKDNRTLIVNDLFVYGLIFIMGYLNKQSERIYIDYESEKGNINIVLKFYCINKDSDKVLKVIKNRNRDEVLHNHTLIHFTLGEEILKQAGFETKINKIDKKNLVAVIKKG